MTGKKHATDHAWTDPDDVPDLTSEDWTEVIDATPVRRGRPKSESPKVSTTLRLDPEVVEHFRASGPGWQTRINEALRKAAGL
jgi:uncharacterized protein (DUF4415 family)